MIFTGIFKLQIKRREVIFFYNKLLVYDDLKTLFQQDKMVMDNKTNTFKKQKLN